MKNIKTKLVLLVLLGLFIGSFITIGSVKATYNGVVHLQSKWSSCTNVETGYYMKVNIEVLTTGEGVGVYYMNDYQVAQFFDIDGAPTEYIKKYSDGGLTYLNVKYKLTYSGRFYVCLYNPDGYENPVDVQVLVEYKPFYGWLLLIIFTVIIIIVVIPAIIIPLKIRKKKRGKNQILKELQNK